jgi:hypothetical protein
MVTGSRYQSQSVKKRSKMDYQENLIIIVMYQEIYCLLAVVFGLVVVYFVVFDVVLVGLH